MRLASLLSHLALIFSLHRKEVQKFEVIKSAVSQKDNKKQIRDRLHAIDPVIPYLGMFLSDILFIEEGHKDLSPDGLINFTKRRQLTAILRQIQALQEHAYNLTPVPVIQVPCFPIRSLTLMR